MRTPDNKQEACAWRSRCVGEVVKQPLECKTALACSKASMVEGKHDIIDVQVDRRGIGWTETPWIPPIKGTEMRTKKV